jgi:membrane protein involved in colicin uptake
MLEGMKLPILIAMAALSLVACERRDGKIIIHEDQAKQKTEEAAQKTAEEAKKLGHEIKEGAQELGEKANQKAEEHKNDPATAPATEKKGIGGGPLTKKCDGGVDCP